MCFVCKVNVISKTNIIDYFPTVSGVPYVAAPTSTLSRCTRPGIMARVGAGNINIYEVSYESVEFTFYIIYLFI